MREMPELFDADLLALRRARADGADFLREAVAREVTDRLIEVNRTFQTSAIVGPRGEVQAEAMRAAGMAAPLLRPDAAVLDLTEGAHDLVVHALSLHWANDPVGQMVQARLALRPDGLFIGTMFGGETLHELRAALATAEVEILGGLSPRVAPMGEIRDLGGLLQRAGFALPVADAERIDVTYASPLDLMRDLRAMGETNVMRARLTRPMRRDMLARACEVYAERFALPDGRIPATFQVLFLTGWAPAPTQLQPLRPGSANARLADALGVPERGAGEKAGR